MPSSARHVAAVLSAALLPTQALAVPLFAPGGTMGWLPPLFRMRHSPVAFDYIVLVAAPLVGILIAVFYYRSALYDALMEMRRPMSVKVRSAGVALFVTALLMMLSPNWPVGVLMVIALVGAIIAAWGGLAFWLVAVASLVVIALVVVKAMHLI